MIEIDIPSIDPIQHEPKIFLGMTTRQCLCIVPGAGLGVGLFMLLYKSSSDIAMVCLMLCVVPAILMGWYAPYNMRFEQFVKLWWFNNFVANAKRIYKTDREEEQKLLTIKERQELEKKRNAEALAERKKKSKKPVKEAT